MSVAALDRRLARLERAAGPAVAHEDWVAAIEGDETALAKIEAAMAA